VIFTKEDNVDKLDAEGKDYFSRIIKASTRMSLMIEDLLTLSKVGKKDVEFEKVKVSELIDEVKDTMLQRLTETNTSIIFNGLPKITCQPVWMKAVFQNLISNSISHSDKDKTTIEITYKELAEYHEFSFKDNGCGIEEDQFEKIFGLFRKAHQNKNSQGSGAGLAIISSVLEQHQGRIKVAWSKPGEGTTMNFTILKNLKTIK